MRIPSGPPRSPRRSQSPREHSNDLPSRPHAKHKRHQVSYEDIDEDAGRRSPPKRSRDDHPVKDKKDERRSRADKEEEEAAPQDDGDEMVDVDEEDDDMAAMQAMMGFGSFGTTKGKKVVGNNAGAVRKEKKSEYRQYMNRQGGFNRPLSPSR